MKLVSNWSILLCLLSATFSLAEDAEEKWDVNAIPGEAREILAKASPQRSHESRSRWIGSATICWMPASMN